jgi:hypothetical protein
MNFLKMAPVSVCFSSGFLSGAGFSAEQIAVFGAILKV